jgi:hypothetical protein
VAPGQQNLVRHQPSRGLIEQCARTIRACPAQGIKPPEQSPLGEFVGKIAVAIPLTNFRRMPPSPLAFPVRVKGTIDWRAELAADEADHARGHIAGVFQKGPEKSYRAELDSKSETHVYAAAAQHECPIGIIEMKISGQLFGGNLVRKPPVAPLLLGREETDRHQLWSLLASTRYTEARPMPSRSAIAVAPSFSSVRRRRTSAGSIDGLRPV